MDTPRYRIKGAHGSTVYVGSIGYFAGTEIDWGGWPDPKLEPVNDAAHRVVRYWSTHQFDPFVPAAPYSSAHGRFYLPAVSADSRGTRWPGPPDKVTFNMPKYRVGAYEPKFMARAVEGGEVVAYLGWPKLEMRLTPINAAAVDVVDYFAANSDNPSLLVSPWNLFDETLFLPTLPNAAKQRADAKVRPATPFATPRKPIDYPENASVVQRALMRGM